MDKLQELKIAYGKGNMEIEDIGWLIEEVERLKIIEQAYEAYRFATPDRRIREDA